jgi:hypothetical protein
MFDFNNPQRRPMIGPDIEPANYVPALTPPSFGEMLALAPKGGANADTTSALTGFGKALGSKMGGEESDESEMADSPMPRRKRPFQVGPPFEDYA